jgi:type I restriction enzyme, S subunit
MNEAAWQQAPLWELVEDDSPITYGVVKPGNEDDNGVLFIRGGDIVDGRILENQLRTITNNVSDQYNRTFLRGGEIIVSLVGNPGQVAIVPNHLRGANIARQVGLVRLKKEVNSYFVKYYLLSSFGQQAFGGYTKGTVQQVINLGDLRDVEVGLPDRDTQDKFAGLLQSLDSKIDLLRRQNQTLENIAQTLFKRWFIDFEFSDKDGKPYKSSGGNMVGSELGDIPEGWRVEKLSNHVKTNVSSISKKSNIQTIQYLDTGSITEGFIEGTQYLNLADAPSRARRIVQHNDILISTVRPNLKHYGILKQPPGNLIVSTGFCVITCNDIDPHFIYLLLTSNNITEYLHSIAEGSKSTYPSIIPSDIENIEFIQPSANMLKLFSEYADNTWNKIRYNQIQIQTLTKTRDTLLPKLMSGQIRVKSL